MRIAVVQGTRPEIIKNYSVVLALQTAGIAFDVLHTNQHSTPPMCQAIYREMGYEPSRTMAEPFRIGATVDWLQRCFRQDRITHVIVNGDTASALAGALAAMYTDIPVCHIEAGLRSRDVQMREERNRIMVDAIASSLFAYTRHELELLERTPDIRGSLHLEGNTTVDVLHDFKNQYCRPLISARYVYVTMHRKEFTDSRRRMQTVCAELRDIAATHCAVVFPIHPRTDDMLKHHGLGRQLLGDVMIMDPVTIFQSLALEKHAAAIVSDSGCIQEEAYLLGVPCVTVRENTERHLTVMHGANVVTGFEPESIRAGIQWALSSQHRKWPPIYGAPGVGTRIVRRVVQHPIDREAGMLRVSNADSAVHQ
jgi:UDP-N-acetylglucosamine 2-epimerase